MTDVVNTGTAANSGNGDTLRDAFIQVNAEFAKRGVPNGYASLGSNGLVPAGQLPGYVDAIIEYATYSAFPAIGSASSIYLALDTGFIYRWSGTVYVNFSGTVNSVNGETGTVTLNASDIGSTAVGGISSTNVQSAIAEIDAEKISATTLAASGGAALVGFSPVGTLASTNVQSAIAEVVSDLAANSGSSLVGFIQNGTGAAARTVQSKLRDTVSVNDFGAVGDGVTDDTAAIQAAINYFSSGNGKVLLSAKTYLVTGSLSVAQNGVVIEGSGDYASRIVFAPTSVGTLLNFSKGSAVIYGSGLRNVWLSSSDTSYTKVAVKFSDVSGSVCDGVRITSWTKTTGKDCIGLQTMGREVSRYSGLTIQADIPLNIANNPNGTLDANEFNFCDLYLIAASTQPCIKVDDGVYWSGLKFSGFQSWVHGAYGFYYSNTTSAAANGKLVFEGVWKEQTDLVAGYVIYISNTAGYCQDVTLNNLTGDTACKGVYGRGIVNLNFIGGNITSASDALNVDGTVLNISGVGLRTQAGATATLTNQQLMSALARHQGTSPVADTFTYQSMLSMGQAQTNFGPIKITASGTGIIAALANNQKLFDASETTNNVNAVAYLTNGYFSIGNVSNNGIRFITNNATKWEIGASGSMIPFADNSYSFGDGTHRPTVLYAVSGTINTSDEREKTEVDEPPIELLKAILSVKIRGFKWNDAIEEKGDSARIHFGPFAQDVYRAVKSAGFDPFKFAFMCFDKWDDKIEPGDDGEQIVVQKAGDRYGLRIDQFYALRMLAIEKKMAGELIV